MTKKIILLFLSGFFTMILIQCQNQKKEHSNESNAITQDSLIKKGQYLVTTLGCNDCHSPKRMGAQGPELIPELMLSGFPASNQLPPIPSEALKNGWTLFYPDNTATVGPWGVSFAGNITPDETGIGTWSLEQFKIAITKGKFKGLENNRPMLPPMPSQNYAQMTDEDVTAIYTYLKSVPPVKNVVPNNIPPSPTK
ncbi:MAG: c-type cytochrome [Saprospiraceae bacterium]|nr:c-type cytochrome [Saprospiraceae bacterium]